MAAAPVFLEQHRSIQFGIPLKSKLGNSLTFEFLREPGPGADVADLDTAANRHAKLGMHEPTTPSRASTGSYHSFASGGGPALFHLIYQQSIEPSSENNIHGI